MHTAHGCGAAKRLLQCSIGNISLVQGPGLPCLICAAPAQSSYVGKGYESAHQIDGGDSRCRGHWRGCGSHDRGARHLPSLRPSSRRGRLTRKPMPTGRARWASLSARGSLPKGRHGMRSPAACPAMVSPCPSSRAWRTCRWCPRRPPPDARERQGRLADPGRRWDHRSADHAQPAVNGATGTAMR